MLAPMPSPAPAPPPEFPPEPWRAAQVPPEAPPGDISFTCPRCGAEASDATYGPCRSCRTDLRSRLGGEGHDVVQEDYVPKMNVTPNAVALKD